MGLFFIWLLSVITRMAQVTQKCKESDLEVTKIYVDYVPEETSNQSLDLNPDCELVSLYFSCCFGTMDVYCQLCQYISRLLIKANMCLFYPRDRCAISYEIVCKVFKLLNKILTYRKLIVGTELSPRDDFILVVRF